MKAATGGQTISATGLTDISGLAVTVGAGGLYEMHAMVMVNLATSSGATHPLRFGMTFPAMVQTRGYIEVPTAMLQVLGAARRTGVWEGDSASGSAIVSAVSGTFQSTFAIYDGIFDVSTNGTIQLQAFTSSGAGNQLIVLAGSYVRLYRLR
jgi:hypothetical protein